MDVFKSLEIFLHLNCESVSGNWQINENQIELNLDHGRFLAHMIIASYCQLGFPQNFAAGRKPCDG